MTPEGRNTDLWLRAEEKFRSPVYACACPDRVMVEDALRAAVAEERQRCVGIARKYGKAGFVNLCESITREIEAGS